MNEIDALNLSQVNSFLLEVDDSFHPPLSSKLDLYEYAEKIFEKASIDIFSDKKGRVLAMIAYYMDEKNEQGYISFLAVGSSSRGLGFAGKLLCECIERCRLKGLISIRLEVSKSNNSAFNLYKKNGFLIDGLVFGSVDKVYMRKSLL